MQRRQDSVRVVAKVRPARLEPACHPATSRHTRATRRHIAVRSLSWRSLSVIRLRLGMSRDRRVRRCRSGIRCLGRVGSRDRRQSLHSYGNDGARHRELSLLNLVFHSEAGERLIINFVLLHSELLCDRCGIDVHGEWRRLHTAEALRVRGHGLESQVVAEVHIRDGGRIGRVRVEKDSQELHAQLFRVRRSSDTRIVRAILDGLVKLGHVEHWCELVCRVERRLPKLQEQLLQILGIKFAWRRQSGTKLYGREVEDRICGSGSGSEVHGVLIGQGEQGVYDGWGKGQVRLRIVTDECTFLAVITMPSSPAAMAGTERGRSSHPGSLEGA
ncbi:hypothetical protein OH76DRAFT_689836 [Lentinus brumalis]|uniref:Uncharacterized protein n=1 Tax=Lentinus brumalis TaxID=2498619 RepID=A0A371D641_9APHY|nr:hypothetical protein OH76DRAFT_689836 [Polyporus brumalis]